MRNKSIPIVFLLIFFLLPGCAGPSKPAVSRVPLQEGPAAGMKGQAGEASGQGDLAPKEKGKRNASPAVRQVTALAGAEVPMPPNTAPTRRDFIRARFPGKKVFFPDELSQPEKKPEYKIGADDVISVLVWNQPDLTIPAVTVRKDGIFSFFSTVKGKLWGGAIVPGRLSGRGRGILLPGLEPVVSQ